VLDVAVVSGQRRDVVARAKELAEEATAAVSEGGASRRQLEELLLELRQLGSEPKE
jgi:hypothetical protein